mmetsp:Transcript_20463/g.43365  ORF Transcript_20463/g.43365 Transcript_20463/m.43365 type:complete len:351 (+) Transcript_20463:848-1900(+)
MPPPPLLLLLLLFDGDKDDDNDSSFVVVSGDSIVFSPHLFVRSFVRSFVRVAMDNSCSLSLNIKDSKDPINHIIQETLKESIVVAAVVVAKVIVESDAVVCVCPIVYRDAVVCVCPIVVVVVVVDGLHGRNRRRNGCVVVAAAIHSVGNTPRVHGTHAVNDPVVIVGNPCVDPRIVVVGTLHAPRDEADQYVFVATGRSSSLQHQRSTRIAPAGIPAVGKGTEHAGTDHTAAQLLPAGLLRHVAHGHLLQRVGSGGDPLGSGRVAESDHRQGRAGIGASESLPAEFDVGHRVRNGIFEFVDGNVVVQLVVGVVGVDDLGLVGVFGAASASTGTAGSGGGAAAAGAAFPIA